jgi:uncharacterized protein
MPEYLSPGVYIEEIDAGPRPIQGVGTSTAGMVGFTQRGPVEGLPTLITSFLEFQRVFGGFVPEPDPSLVNAWAQNASEGGRWWLFPQAVAGFFANGGQRVFIKRAASSQATPSSTDLVAGLVSAVTSNTTAGATEVELAHLVGIENNATVTIVRSDTGAAIGANFNVDAYNGVTRRVTLSPAVPDALEAGRDFVVVVPVDPTRQTLRFRANAPGAWGNGMQVRVRPTVDTLRLLAEPTEGPTFATRLAADAAANAATVDVELVPGLPTAPFFVQIVRGRFEVTSVDPVPGQANQRRLTLNPTAHPAWARGLAVRRVRRANPAGAADNLLIAAASRLYPGAVVELDKGTDKETRVVRSVSGERVTFDANTAADYFETDTANLVQANVSVRFAAPGAAVVTEEFGPLRLAPDDANNLVRAVNQRSQLVQVEALPGLSPDDPTRFPTGQISPLGTWVELGGGDDRANQLRVEDFVGAENQATGLRTGILAMEQTDEIAIAAVPGMWSRTIQSALIDHCQLLKDRFAILDPRDGLNVNDIQQFASPLETRYAALYHPWLVVRDPVSGLDVQVPPSGHMAGIYARVDVERGVHKAPANVVIRGIKLDNGLAQVITKRQQDLLNPRGINVLRFFPGLGYRVWGARTVSDESQWRYVNVRRLFIFVEESIEEGTQWVVFEPNDEPLWALVRQSITNFLIGVWRSGALAGTTADEAFFVACDRTTMTQDDIDNGRLICVIGIAPVFPAEFVIFRIQQKTREAQPA